MVAYDRSVRVLTTTTPSKSSVQSIFPLCRALQDAGHEVLVAMAPNYTPWVRQAGLDAVGAGPEWDHAVCDEYVPGWTTKSPKAYMATTAEVAGWGVVEDVLPLAESWGPDVILHVHHDLAGWIVAERLGIPNVPFAMTLRWLDPGLLRMFAGPQVEALIEKYGLAPDPDLVRPSQWLYLDTSPRALTSGFFPEPPNVHHIRYTSDDTEGDPSLPAWIDGLGDRLLVYVTMGTIFNRVGNLLRTLTQGAAQLDVEVLVTPSSNFPVAELGDLPPNVHVEGYVPHSALIPRCAAVVCHASSSNVFGALADGVPLVLAPVSSDQPASAFFCDQKGFAVSCASKVVPGEVFPTSDLDALTPEKVAEALDKVLSTPSYREAVQGAAESIRNDPPVTHAVSLMERLVATNTPIHHPLP